MLRIEISVARQELCLISDDGRTLQRCVVSTAAEGIGSQPGSNKTPSGRFRIKNKIGAGALWGTIFISRQAVGLWSPAFPTDNDLITSRILWLDGMEKENANTHSRYIYIHGTNQEHLLGTPASHGCIRMANHDVIALFDSVKVGTEVTILTAGVGRRKKP
ncbi:MAG: L,D-transpeptidase [Verrucomicrobiales bacterium]|nr:L,D-transpeptidase [Verrucomicrobiales bacterium]